MSDPKRPKKHIRKFSWNKAQAEAPQKLSEQGHILAGLNVLQVLEDNAPLYLQNVLYYPPKLFSKASWAAALVWYRQKGYHQYKDLALFGVWVAKQDEHNQIIIGRKQLRYSAPVYTPEAYHVVIQQDFRSYYGDDGSPPPPDAIHYQKPYKLSERLALRSELKTEIIQWLRFHQH